MTAASPVPVHPRLGARVAYRLQRVLRPNGGYRWLSKRIEASGPARALFTEAERMTKETAFGCRMCGQCTLPVTGYACPESCPKGLRNGPCGGVGADGTCEVFPGTRCVWVAAYERAERAGREADLLLLQRPVDHRRSGQTGESSRTLSPCRVGRGLPVASRLLPPLEDHEVPTLGVAGRRSPQRALEERSDDLAR